VELGSNWGQPEEGIVSHQPSEGKSDGPATVDAEVTARAVELVARKTKPVRVIAEELGVPCKTRYRWMEATRQHPAEPFVGHGPRRGED